MTPEQTPDGYSPLEVGEPVLKGYRFYAGEHFIETSGPGPHWVQGASTEDIQYYRPIPAPSPVAPSPREIWEVKSFRSSTTFYRAAEAILFAESLIHEVCPEVIHWREVTPPEATKATQGEPTAPERIWVTYDEKETPVAVETDDRDACKTDVEYIRADQVEALRTWIRKLEAVITITHAEYEKLLPELAALKAKE